MRVEADAVVLYERVNGMENNAFPNLWWLMDPMVFFGGNPSEPVGLHYVACLTSEGDSDGAGLLGQLMADMEAEAAGKRPEYRILMEKLFGAFVAEMEDKHPEYRITTEEFPKVVFYSDDEGSKGRVVKLVHRDSAYAGSPFYVFIEFNMFGTGVRPHAVMHIYQTAKATAAGIENGTCRGEDSLRIGEGASELTVGLVGGTLLHPSIKDEQGKSVGAKVPSFYANHVLDDALPYCDVRSEFFESVEFSSQSGNRGNREDVAPRLNQLNEMNSPSRDVELVAAKEEKRKAEEKRNAELERQAKKEEWAFKIPFGVLFVVATLVVIFLAS